MNANAPGQPLGLFQPEAAKYLLTVDGQESWEE